MRFSCLLLLTLATLGCSADNALPTTPKDLTTLVDAAVAADLAVPPDLALPPPDLARMTCAGVLTCITTAKPKCDNACLAACTGGGTMIGNMLLTGLFQCALTNCPTGPGQICAKGDTDPSCKACQDKSIGNGGACNYMFNACLGDDGARKLGCFGVLNCILGPKPCDNNCLKNCTELGTGQGNILFGGLLQCIEGACPRNPMGDGGVAVCAKGDADPACKACHDKAITVGGACANNFTQCVGDKP